MLVGERAIRSCVTPAVSCTQPITTIEGLETRGQLHPLQQAFLDAEALQCGYCTPGMILGAVALLNDDAAPDPRPDRECHERPRLPVRHLPADRRGDRGGQQGAVLDGEPAMSPQQFGSVPA